MRRSGGTPSASGLPLWADKLAFRLHFVFGPQPDLARDRRKAAPGGRQLARTLAIRARSGDRDSALLSAAARWSV